MLTIRPPAGLDHRRDHGLAGQEGPDHVDVEDRAEVLERDVLGRRLDRPDHAGGVDEDVDAAEALVRGARELGGRGLVGDVTAHRQRLELAEVLLQVPACDSIASMSRPASTSAAPSSASATQIGAPMPLAAPVTIATLP